MGFQVEASDEVPESRFEVLERPSKAR